MRHLAFLNRRYQLQIEDEADESVMAEIFLNRDYALVEPALRAATHGVLDVGAHKGFFILYLRALNATVPVWAYEPEEANFRALKNHMYLNDVQHVIAKNAAIMGKEGMVLLNVSEDSHNHSFVVQPGTTRQQKVSAVSLAQVLQKMGGCDLVKMDCEGAEFEIFAEAPASVFKVPTYFLEYHEYAPTMQANHLKAMFEQHGYRVRIIPSKYDKRMGFLWAERG